MITQEVIELNTEKLVVEQDAEDAAAYAAWKLANGIQPGPMSREQYVLLFDPCAQGGL